MERFYFHVFNGETSYDEEGQELPDLEAARACAIKEARALMGDTLRAGRIVLSHHISVESQSGEVLLDVKFGDAVAIEP